MFAFDGAQGGALSVAMLVCVYGHYSCGHEVLSRTWVDESERQAYVRNKA